MLIRGNSALAALSTQQRRIKNIFWGDIMKNTKKGFTLVELIVVIAIIGVLAAILVPSLLGYVRAAKLKADVGTAKRLYEAIQMVFVNDDQAMVSFHKHNTSTKNVTVTMPDNTTESYNVAVICYLNGNKKQGNASTVDVMAGNSETQDFCTALTKQIERNTAGVTSGKRDIVFMPMKTNRINGRKVDTWVIVCRREKDARGNYHETDVIEIWANHRYSGASDNDNDNPIWRVYPGTCKEFSDD